jgi:putative ABC transport system ATP-binding protein
MIELENIKKHYSLNGKDVPILKGISLFIGQGEFVSIMGPSGSGKSTLSAILGCLSTPTSGTYKLGGKDVTKLGGNDLAGLRNQHIGFIFQDFNLLSGLTALENVALPLVYGGMSAKSRRDRAMECLAAVGLDHKAQNRPFQLSGGQKQRVAIARALVNHPKFLFADEPTGALDKKTGHEILSIMQRLNAQGHTVIQVTHSPLDAQYSKRILHLVDGNIIREETVDKPVIGSILAEDEASRSEILTRVWRVAQVAPVDVKRDLEAIKRLIAETTTRDAQVAAARAVIRWPGHEADACIEALFTSSEWVVRAEVVKNLNLRPKDQVLSYYERALSDDNAWVRHLAMSELKDTEMEELSESLRQAIVKSLDDTDERVRASAIFITGKWRRPERLEWVAKALEDRDNRVRANAVEALNDDDDIRRFLERLEVMARSDRSNRVRANAAFAVGKIDAEKAMQIAGELLTSTEVLMRSSGAWLIGAIKAKGGHERLMELLTHEKEEVVLNQVVRSLAKLSRDLFPLKDQIDVALGATNSGV